MSAGYSGGVLRENELLSRIAAAGAGMPASVSIPPGDDMGMVRIAGADVLIAVDPLIEGVHFDRATASLEQIGRKAITRNLSDVAAMAAKPVAAVVSAVLVRGFSQVDAETLFDAVRVTGERYGCPVVGGDVAFNDGPLTLTVTVLAEPDGVEPVRRGTANPGDRLYVTGQLGNSAAGHHLDFEPRLSVARALASDPKMQPTAMMDISDGLAQDLPRLCPHAVVNVAVLPIREGTASPRWQHAIGDGEDYELLLATKNRLPARVAGVALTCIGEVTETGGVVFLDAGGNALDVTGFGWEHRS